MIMYEHTHSCDIESAALLPLHNNNQLSLLHEKAMHIAQLPYRLQRSTNAGCQIPAGTNNLSYIIIIIISFYH